MLYVLCNNITTYIIHCRVNSLFRLFMAPYICMRTYRLIYIPWIITMGIVLDMDCVWPWCSLHSRFSFQLRSVTRTVCPAPRGCSRCKWLIICESLITWNFSHWWMWVLHWPHQSFNSNKMDAINKPSTSAIFGPHTICWSPKKKK